MLIAALLAIPHLFASASLDSQMTPEEQKATGLYKLNTSQKAALQQWIDHLYAQNSGQSGMTPSQAPAKNPVLSENLMNSRFLRLSDNSLWSIRPEDVPIAQGWITPVEIVVAPSGDPFYPTKLTNQVSGSSVLARQVQQLPSQPPQNLSQ